MKHAREPGPEYIHVVAYFNRTPASPFDNAHALLLALTESLRLTDEEVVASIDIGVSGEHLPDDVWHYDRPLHVSRFQQNKCQSPSATLGRELGRLGLNAVREINISRYVPRSSFGFFDFDWSIGYHDSSDYPNAQHDATLKISISTELVAEKQFQMGIGHFATHNLIRKILLPLKPYYALIDCTPFQVDAAGALLQFEGPASNHSSIRSQIERRLWERAKAGRHSLVRGVRWAHLLTERHLEKLGGSIQFIDEFTKHIKRLPFSNDYIQQLDKASVLVCMSSTPMYFSRFGSGVAPDELADWLYGKFTECSLFV